MCQVEGCVGKVVSNGLCDKHRKQVARHGKLGTTRPARWGEKENHILYDSWYALKRSNKLAEEWLDFWKFVSDVGKREKDCRLSRINATNLFSSTNFYWKKIKQKKKDYNSISSYMRDYRKQNPEIHKNIELKKRFGITLDEFNLMKQSQSSVCAICGNPETTVHRQTGKINELSVDHCHTTGKIRGLLCNHCNHAIGKFKDNPEYLQKAINYLLKDK